MVGWLVVFTGIIIIREEKIGEEKIRSGQAGLLVPKAATARESLKPPLSPPVKRENLWRA